MADQLEIRIETALRAKPGMTAKEIAIALGADKTQVNGLLYGVLSGKVFQDKKYRWFPAEKKETPRSSLSREPLNTPLARMCHYYLACLGQDDEAGISVFAFNQYGAPDYCELAALPDGDDPGVFQSPDAQRLIAALRKDKSRLALYFGYPTTLKKVTSKKGWEGFFVEPLILIPVEFDEGSQGRPRLAQGFPLINLKALKRLTGAERDGIMEELVQLEEELGLTVEGELPEIDELVQRLAAIRPEWQWQEPCNPAALGSDPPLSKADQEGIYNRAVLVVAERSPYTQGLESELKGLAQLQESAYAKTALGQWISNSIPARGSATQDALVEVMPLNSEQRQAVKQALANPITIITGPPGTGKSQVVADILINAAWQGKRVLFASKNNKAVDVVEVRINNLGPRPILLRVGSNQYQTKLAEYLLDLLAATATQEDRMAYDEALATQKALESQEAALATKEREVIALRNRVDEAERTAEAARAQLGPSIFAATPSIDLAALNKANLELALSVQAAAKKAQPLPIRVLWKLLRKGRFDALSSAVVKVSSTISLLKVPMPSGQPDDSSIPRWVAASNELTEKIESAEAAKAYLEALASLQRVTPLEQIAKARGVILAKMAANAERLWRAWLRLQPTKLTQNDRQLLHKYSALLKMVIATGVDGKLGPQVFREYQNLFPKVAHLLPCWAVTSLSAKGKIPFEPGFFDLVVFDEASQCDIASALPLLFRAKRAAVIGDPKQLSHITGLPKGQDQKLLEKHKLLSDYPHWAYSFNSLFDLASGYGSGEDIVSLRDHHRSHADIIEFSNEFFYESRLRVATRYNLLCRPTAEPTGVRWVNVSGQTIRPNTGGAFNREEAKAVVAELRRLVIERGYKGTVGVVSPFRAQANLIREMVLADQSLAEELARHEFLSDTVHKFQGDERDLMIFSPVVSKGISPGAIGFLKNNGNLFNVAITRARAMLLVVGDLSEASHCEVDYLASFAQYTQDLREKQHEGLAVVNPDLGAEYPKVSNPEQVSDWERLFYRALYKAGVRTIPQYQVEKYALDLALIIDENTRLDIEVDGERYHRAWDGELCRRDQMRNQRLYELGWDVMRFWVYEVRDDLAGCIKKVSAWNKPQE